MPILPSFRSFALPARSQRGFTWIEMLMVIGVLAALALMAIPGLQDQALKRQVRDGLALAAGAKNAVQAAWSLAGAMPANNKDAGLPDKEKIVGNLIKEVSVKDGAITLVFGNNASAALLDKKVTLRPAVVKDTPSTPIAWLCAQVSVPGGMEVMGQNETDIKASWLPVECRGAETTK
jgi:type IV pilus assembly protein PilA